MLQLCFFLFFFFALPWIVPFACGYLNTISSLPLPHNSTMVGWQARGGRGFSCTISQHRRPQLSRPPLLPPTVTVCLLVGTGWEGMKREGRKVVELDTRFSQDDEPYGGTGTCSLSSLKNALSSLQMVRTSSSPLYFPSKLSPLAPCLPRPMGEFVCAHVCVCVFS